MSTWRRYTPFILLAGDVLALLLFVAVGQRDHDLVDAANPLGRLLLVTASFVAPWAIAGWLLGAFPRSEAVSARMLLARSLNTWLVAAPLGVLVRAYLLGLVVVTRMFLVAGLAFGGLFLFIWRAAFLLVWSWLGRRAEAKQSESAVSASSQ